MKNLGRSIALIGATVLVVAGLALGCSKSDNKSTNPGGGGTELNSGNIGNGTQFVHVFATAGTFPYHCSIHTVMHGTVTVSAVADSDTIHVQIVSPTSNGFQPASASIKPNGIVIWKNVSGITHTVTSD